METSMRGRLATARLSLNTFVLKASAVYAHPCALVEPDRARRVLSVHAETHALEETPGELRGCRPTRPRSRSPVGVSAQSRPSPLVPPRPGTRARGRRRDGPRTTVPNPRTGRARTTTYRRRSPSAPHRRGALRPPRTCAPRSRPATAARAAHRRGRSPFETNDEPRGSPRSRRGHGGLDPARS